jgi:hypothetical protein
MGSFGPGGEIDRGRARDLKMIELIDRGFAMGPERFAAAAPASVPVVPPPTAGEMPTIKTDKTVPAVAAEQQSSTPAEPMFEFRVIPPEKKP